MNINAMNNYSNIVGAAMQAAVLRDNVISHNISNADTPLFRRGDVAFETHLGHAVDNFRRTNQLDLTNVRPQVVRDFSDLRYRFDGNNVDIEAEMASLYQNSVRFDIMASGIMNHYRIINMVIGVQI